MCIIATYCVFPSLSPFTVTVLSSTAFPVFSGNEKYVINVFPKFDVCYSIVTFGIVVETIVFSGLFVVVLLSPKLSVHIFMSTSDGLDVKRCPCIQFPDFASLSSSSPLCPSPEDAEVQNGITVFPLKSFAFTNVSTGHAAIPPPYRITN